MTFDFSLGTSRYDVHPKRMQAQSLREYARIVLSHRAASKATAGYISAAFGNDGRRSAANALPRRFLALDVDGITPDAFVAWRLFLTRWRGFGWPTASSTPDAPRERVVVELSETVDRHQGMQIGELLIRDVQDEFGVDVAIDRCTFRPEQPCFLPLHGAEPFYLLGDALDVHRWLEQVPNPPPPPPPASVEVAELADVRMRHIVGQLQSAGLLTKPLANGRGYAMVCPWQTTHTTADEPGNSATALMFPSEANGWRGGFHCLHAHCAHRRLRDVADVLRAAERMAA